MTDYEEQNDELMALSEILDKSEFLYTQSESGVNTGVMTVTINLPDDSGLQVIVQVLLPCLTELI